MSGKSDAPGKRLSSVNFRFSCEMSDSLRAGKAWTAPTGPHPYGRGSYQRAHRALPFFPMPRIAVVE